MLGNDGYVDGVAPGKGLPYHEGCFVGGYVEGTEECAAEVCGVGAVVVAPLFGGIALCLMTSSAVGVEGMEQVLDVAGSIIAACDVDTVAGMQG